jgi:hypothetical protein
MKSGARPVIADFAWSLPARHHPTINGQHDACNVLKTLSDDHPSRCAGLNDQRQ